MSVSNSSAVFTNILYVSYTATTNFTAGNNGDYFTHFSGPQDSSAGSLVDANHASPGSFRIGVAMQHHPGGIPIRSQPGPPHTVVARLLLNNSSNNAVSTLWIDPVNEYSSSVTATDIVTSGGINLYGFRQPGSTVSSPGPVKLTVDNLLVGTSFCRCGPSQPQPALGPDSTGGHQHYFGRQCEFPHAGGRRSGPSIPVDQQWHAGHPDDQMGHVHGGDPPAC